MSFRINWSCVEKESFTQYVRETLNDAMNSGKKPNILSDSIKIVDLNFGSIPPDFEILEIGDLGSDRFRGIFKFNYYGDASVTLTTKVSASLLKNYNNNITDILSERYDCAPESVSCDEMAAFIKPNFIVSDCDFDIPLYLTLSAIKMSSIIVVVFSASKGLTLVFKNDPLESIEVNSTFDKIKPIAKFLQDKIEKQIGELFREFLPSMLYKFSLEYTTQSFDQFHKAMSDDQEEEEPRVMLKDIDPDAPMGISPGSLMRLTRLASSRQTLAIGGELSCDRMNSSIVTKAFANAILASSNSFAFSKLHLSGADFVAGAVGAKVNVIKDFQTKTFLKSRHEKKEKPHRRVIKLRRKKKAVEKKQPEMEENSVTAAAPTPVEKAVSPLEKESEEESEEGPDDDVTLVAGRMEEFETSPSHYTSSITSSTLYNEKDELESKAMSRGGSSRSSNMSSSSRQGEIKAATTVPVTEDRPTLEQLLALQETLRDHWATLPAKLRTDIEDRSSNHYHIGKDERREIARRISKLDELLNKKNARKSDTGLEAPPPYSYL